MLQKYKDDKFSVWVLTFEAYSSFLHWSLWSSTKYIKVGINIKAFTCMYFLLSLLSNISLISIYSFEPIHRDQIKCQVNSEHTPFFPKLSILIYKLQL